VVDLPPEESESLRRPAIAKGLDYVPLVAPTSDRDRIAKAAAAATSFIYYVSMTGVTGSKSTDLNNASERAAALQHELKRPLAVGFGVKTKQDVAIVARHVDGVVVGSAVVSAIEHAENPAAAVSAVRALVAELAAGAAWQ
jgi:tryptophan synthase alpha chain